MKVGMLLSTHVKGSFFRPSSIFGVSKIMKFLMLTLGSAKLYIDGETH